MEESVVFISHLNRQAGGRDHEVVTHEVELMIVEAGCGGINLHIVSVLHLFVDMLIHSSCDIWFGEYLVVEHCNPSCGSLETLTKFHGYACK